HQDHIRPFDLSQAPLLRKMLVKMENAEHYLLVDMHHVISDGISHEILVKEFITFYRDQTPKPLRIQYKDFALWQKGQINNDYIRLQETYWLKQYNGEIPILKLPYDFPRPSVQNFEGGIIDFRLNEKVTAALRNLALKEGATLYMLLLAMCNIFLAKISGMTDIVIGTPVAGRRHADLESIMGMFVNTLALRNYTNPDRFFPTFLQEVKKQTLAAFENQDYPFEDLVEKVAVERNPGRNPLFDVMFSMNTQNQDTSGNKGLETDNHGQVPENKNAGLQESDLKRKHGTSKFDLSLNVLDSDDQLFLSFEYCTTLFKVETIERFITYFNKTATDLTARPHMTLAELDIVPEVEKKQVLIDFNQTITDYPAHKTLTQLFEERAAMAPDTIALVGTSCNDPGAGKQQISFKELDNLAGQSSSALIHSGIRPGDIVGLMAEPSIDMMVGILGILKAEAAYLPINPGLPAERINYMLADSHAQTVLYTKPLQPPHGSPTALELPLQSPLTGNNAPLPRRPESLAYIIYTSGSTGAPKGVMVEHRNVTAYIHSFYHQFNITPDDTVIQLASFAFDIFIEEVFPLLLKGGKILIPTKGETMDMSMLFRLIHRHQVSIMDCTPLLLNQINKYCAETGSHNRLESLHTIISGGDTLKAEYVDTLVNIGRVYNTYGPTETTVCATYHRLPTPGQQDGPPIPIGSPIANYCVYIYDRFNNQAPIGVAGQLCVSGTGVARGYLNRPELTAEKFTTFETSNETGILYNTGDLGRWLPDGNIEFLGRIDHQVKIRGYRIEPGEIENRLMEHPAIQDAVVIAREHNGDKYLCAYFVTDVPVQQEQLETHLQNSLPDYMLPTYFTPVKSIPLTPTGKTDRNALPEPTLQSGNTFIAPRDNVETKLVEVWSDVL
ncbi:MAG: amino acid adenylation domain-containing protein, partial [bacterium]|nr:amino acid adenylation domain-containing protein [bacterium]